MLLLWAAHFIILTVQASLLPLGFVLEDKRRSHWLWALFLGPIDILVAFVDRAIDARPRPAGVFSLRMFAPINEMSHTIAVVCALISLGALAALVHERLKSAH